MKFTSTKDVANKNACMLIAGESGIGKTYLARTLEEKDTLIVSAESGLMSLTGTDIKVAEVESMDDTLKIIEQMKEGKLPFKNIYFDSLTEILDQYVAELKLRYSRKDAFPMWDDYMSRAVYIIKAARDCSYNTFFTCLTKQDKDGLEMVDVFDFAGKSLRDKVKSYFDIVIHYKMHEMEDKSIRAFITSNELSNLSKDRSGILNKIEKPHLGELLTKIIA